jgi:hypothetical protein
VDKFELLEAAIEKNAEAIQELQEVVSSLQVDVNPTVERPPEPKPQMVEKPVTIKGQKYLIKLPAWRWGGQKFKAEEVVKDKKVLEEQLEINPSVFVAVSEKK